MLNIGYDGSLGRFAEAITELWAKTGQEGP